MSFATVSLAPPRSKAVSSVVLAAAAALGLAPPAFALNQESYVSSEKGADRFALCAEGQAVPLYADADDYPGVLRALKDLQADVERVTKVRPDLATRETPSAREVVIVGTLGKSKLVDQLVRDKKLDVTGIAGRWETSLTQVVDKPLPGVERALVIAGSDKRGTIYGIYDLSEQIGVSPWYWWADVPVRRRDSLYVLPGRHSRGEPAVKYRGIFINDEAPCLSGWAKEKFGGFNHKFYEKVFELLLRLRANYLWPAMWGSAFNEDDAESPRLADEYGIVMGTSHQEPMLRAQAEFDRRYKPELWNYATHPDVMEKFWREGVRRNRNYESIITIGMRGRNDSEMIPGATVEQSAALLEKIVAAQRKILAEEVNPDVTKVPQLWCLYKEVQGYYEHGLRVPDDVTLLWSDDNWGDLRRLPTPEERKRGGGAGVYYHFDYVGAPRCYKWLNTNPIPKVWEQMHLAYAYGADRVWIVNVGDIKPMEFPLEFFLDYAWAPEKWPAERLGEYTRVWAAREFGGEHAADIADVLAKYTKFNGRRKPELLAPDTYSLVNYREAEREVADYNKLAEEADRIYASLPAESKDAYYQLVLYPVKACANLNDLYVTAARNRLYADQGRAATNDLAERARNLFHTDADLADTYNHTLAGGKWVHMMDQTHIGYTSWGDPKENNMPEVREIELPAAADMGVVVEGSAAWWPKSKEEPLLPALDPYQQQAHYMEIFNRGQAPFEYTAQAGVPWLRIEPARGKVDKEQRIWVSVDWGRAPVGSRRVPIELIGAGETHVVVQALIDNPESPKPDQVKGFVEANGYVSIEAEHWTRAVNTDQIQWRRLPDYGRTLSAMTAFPVTAASQTPGGDSPHLEYRLHLFRAGDFKVQAYFAPTLNFTNRPEGLRYAVSFDDERPQVFDIQGAHPEADWGRSVADAVKTVTSRHTLADPGDHVLKVWMVDPGVVLEKLVVDAGGVRPSYLGPPESCYRASRTSP